MEDCCASCFTDDYLAEHIRTHGQAATCHLCGDHNVPCMDTDTLKELFEPVVALYKDVEEYMPTHFLKELAGTHPTLADVLTDEWGIFDNTAVARKFLNACCAQPDPRNDLGQDCFDPERSVGDEELFFLGEYHETEQLSTLWGQLKGEVRTANRFFAGRRTIGRIVRALRPLAHNLVPEPMYRARPSKPDGSPLAITEMGAPPPELAAPGRANPSGIPYLYLASDRKTAVSELRPHVGDAVSIGKFKLNEPVRVVDLRNPRIASPFEYGMSLREILRTLGFLKELGNELSRPVGGATREAEYLPTQYLCELMKVRGFKGVLYKSGVGPGHNIALFDPGAATCASVTSFRVKGVNVTITKQ